jgi:hypothetical protein
MAFMLLLMRVEIDMKLRKLLTSLPLIALTILPAVATAGDRNGRNYRYERDQYQRDRYGYYGDQNRYNSSRTMRGHRPFDNNGDGVVTRREWPGNGNSFRRLDRDHDGVLSERDRRLQRRDSRYYDWRR